MVEFSEPYLVPLIFLFFLLCIGFGIGAIVGEITTITWGEAERKGNRELRWLLLIIPSLVGVFLILWWPSVQLGGG